MGKHRFYFESIVFFRKKIYFGCAVSSLLCMAFLQLRGAEALHCCGAWAFHFLVVVVSIVAELGL